MRHAAIAQLDRVTDYESVGRGFESLLPYQEIVPISNEMGTISLCKRRESNPFKCPMPVAWGGHQFENWWHLCDLPHRGKSAIESLLPYQEFEPISNEVCTKIFMQMKELEPFYIHIRVLKEITHEYFTKLFLDGRIG